ncbi:prepilin-type N-terminal cleavage/methylation domain-containing protein [Deinococcus sp.]|uniref:pilus assembly FimT family protein n=1 Tax=Deinococcus sp. TaxID=47478 RepID=UPI0025EBC120|nr:prepilin-type N-terminal cleavage/methylation domain-containing protein [Deinococcus sp.]
MRRRHAGFTLLELIVVMVIVGILVTIGFTIYGDIRQKEVLRQGAQQFSADLNNSRSIARRLSQTVQVTANSGTSTYTITRPISGTSTMTTFTLPENMTFTAPLSVTFQQPYGFAPQFLNSDGQQTTLTLANRSISVAVIGLAGKVVVREN